MNTTTPTLTQQYRADIAKAVVADMTKSMHSAHTWSKILLFAGMALTYLHVALYLHADPAFGPLGFGIPAFFDGGMIVMFNVVQTRGLAGNAKRAAMAVATVLGITSGYLNCAAASSVRSAIIFASIVAGAVAVKFVAALMTPDFTAMEEAEQQVAADLPTDEPAEDPEAAARRQASIAKARDTRKRNAEIRQAEQEKAEQDRLARLDRRRKQDADRRAAAVAPVSPGAPVEHFVLDAAAQRALDAAAEILDRRAASMPRQAGSLLLP